VSPHLGPVTIETFVDFTTDPVVGVFEVTEGADTLGCSSGTFYDTFDFGTEDVTRTMSCSEGDTGAVIIVFDPDGYDTGPGDDNGPWHVVGATVDFTGLQGEGDFWGVTDGSHTDSAETFTGDIEYTG
jgi:hypothetical protein